MELWGTGAHENRRESAVAVPPTEWVPFLYLGTPGRKNCLLHLRMLE
jgi:hypothetical protein